jgi:hypothetical protein
MKMAFVMYVDTIAQRVEKENSNEETETMWKL